MDIYIVEIGVCLLIIFNIVLVVLILFYFRILFVFIFINIFGFFLWIEFGLLILGV